MRVLFITALCLGLGACGTAQQIGSAAGQGTRAFGVALATEPLYPVQPRARTVVIERPVYVRPVPRPVTRTITTRVERSW
jgi:hypothetical protein